MKQPDTIRTLISWQGIRFRFNTAFVVDIHSVVHTAGSAFLCILVFWTASLLGHTLSILNAYGIVLLLGILWEITDGLKPLYFENIYGDWRDQILRADGFSWSDILFDLLGCLSGWLLLTIWT